MKGRFLYLVVLGIFLIFQFPACLATERTGQNKSCKYLGVVREFADNELKYGRDNYV